MAKRRTAAELLSDLKRQQAELEARVALEEAQSNPALAPILNRIEKLKAQQVSCKSGFSTGPNNFEDRIAKHQNWINEIEAQRNLATAESDYLAEEISYYQDAISEIVNEETDPDTVVENAPNIPDEIQELRDAVETMQSVRKAFTEELKKPKRKVKKVQEEETQDDGQDEMDYEEA